jgi:class 3 adenylate cyclase
MATDHLLQVQHGALRPSVGAIGRAETAAPTRSTRVRPEIRAKRVAAACLTISPASGRLFTLRHRGAAADTTLPTRDDVQRRDAGRFLTTVLMTDIVDSTHTVARLGDRRWRELLAAHFADTRAEVKYGGGELVNTTGDGILAIFDSPTRAIHAGLAIQALARASGMEVRAGVHTGECERLEDGLAGVTVHITARICALGEANEVMTTETVRTLVIGSMLTFEPRGRRKLRGVPGDWTVFTASDPV